MGPVRKRSHTALYRVLVREPHEPLHQRSNSSPPSRGARRYLLGVIRVRFISQRQALLRSWGFTDRLRLSATGRSIRETSLWDENFGVEQHATVEAAGTGSVWTFR